MRRAGPLDGLRRSGAAAVTGGLLVQGVTSYGFLTAAARGLSEAEFSVVAALWSAVYALANGLFSPLEQETTRAVAERISRGERIGPVLLRVAGVGGGMAAMVAVVLLAGHDPLARRVFSGETGMVAVLAVGVVGAAAMFITRGVLAGTRRYWTYAAQLAGDGVLRLLVALLVLAAGAATALRLGALVAAAPLVVLALTLLVLPRPGGSDRHSAWGEVTTNLGWLVVAAASSYGVSNAGPVVLQLIGRDDPGLAGRFLAAFVVVRIPLFFTSALQASLLPQLVGAVERGDSRSFSAALTRMVTVVSGLGAFALLVFAVAGPAVVSLLFGARYAAARFDVVALGASSVLFVLATLLQSAALALGGHRAVAACWAAGAALFAVSCTLPLEPVARLELGYFLSAMVVLGLLSIWLLRRRAGDRVTPGEPDRTVPSPVEGAEVAGRS